MSKTVIIDTECVDGIFVPKSAKVIKEEKSQQVSIRKEIEGKKKPETQIPSQVEDFLDGMNQSLNLVDQILKRL